MSADPAAIEAERARFLLSQISNEMVRIYEDQFGRGEVRARTYWCGPDALAVLLEDTLTTSDRRLIGMGESARLRDMRTLIQYSTVGEFCEPIERLTGRKVRAFVSGIDTAVEGFSVETFVLYPYGADAPSRAAAM